MGLTSLPILNKMGYLNFWQNVWLNNLQSQHLSSLFYSIDIIFNLMCNERYILFNYLKLDRNSYISYDSTHYTLSDKFSKTYVGEIWVLCYSNWIVLSPMFHNFNVISEDYMRTTIPSRLLILNDLVYIDDSF